jgi:DNA ligase D-like protein (predicted 3'-phosphoesterase)
VGAQKDLKAYKQRRNFRRSPEPAGRRRRPRKEPIFVIQKHDATTVHYDLRLEASGVLKSWAVPKGPSLNPRDKRMAKQTEDHPLDYAGFEGFIPKGNYGGGSVIVWDTGTYENLTESDDDEVSIEDAVANGHVKFWLEGTKIRGGFALTRVARGKDERWLLVKMKDEGADARRNPVTTQQESVLTGRTTEDVAEESSEG